MRIDVPMLSYKCYRLLKMKESFWALYNKFKDYFRILPNKVYSLVTISIIIISRYINQNSSGDFAQNIHILYINMYSTRYTHHASENSYKRRYVHNVSLTLTINVLI